MANDTTITVVGNLTVDPELRFTPSGSAVANFTIASTPKQFDKASGEFKDGETLFLRCNIWREAAENVAESLTKGTRVVAQGRLKSRSYDKDGEKRTVIELEVEEIGPSLRWASAKVTRVQRGNGGNTQQAAPAQQGQGWGSQNHDNQQSAGNLYPERGQQAAPAADPWSAPSGQQQMQNWGNGDAVNNAPPF